jgi:hypothetical protein
MAGKAFRFLASGVLAACLAIPSPSRSPVVEHSAVANGLTVHEWGTFTSVAGPDGQAVAWAPLAASADLPAFVEHFRDENLKCSLSGTVRMETPVLYFYSPREITVSVQVSFAKGIITEWYPHASAVGPVVPAQDDGDGSIRWDAVRLVPGTHAAFPAGSNDNHYYAARNTAATPVRVNAPGGGQNEKFLFYRGVSSAALPIAARLTPEGKVLVQNLGTEEIPSVILIESRGGRLGYRVAGGLYDRALVEPPALTAATVSMNSMLKDLEGLLVASGLYVDEAHAVIATWRNSWFEEGSRLLYILPAQALNALLPLAVHPAPVNTTRVFVGRMELVTPATEKAVGQAFAGHDGPALEKYRRFLVPILNAMIANAQADPAQARELRSYVNTAYSYACRPPRSEGR